jgi:hypothetical protein
MLGVEEVRWQDSKQVLSEAVDIQMSEIREKMSELNLNHCFILCLGQTLVHQGANPIGDMVIGR